MVETADIPSAQDPGKPGDRLFSFEDEAAMRTLKEIKVKLPVSQHIKLHSLKITQNRPISEVVKLALEDYFQRLESRDNAQE